MRTEEELRTQLAQVKKYLDIKEAALLSNFSVSSIRRRVKDGALKPFQSVPRGKLLFKRSQIESFIENGTDK